MNEFRSGWRELVGATVGLACGAGSYAPISSFFFRALEGEFGWSKTAAASSFVALPITALVLPFVGKLLDRYSVRRIAFASAVLMSACYMVLSAIQGQLVLFYLASIGLWVLGCATGPISYTRVISQCFIARRGTALAIALLGVAIAGIVFPPIIASVLSDNGGWRTGYRLLALVALLGGGFAVLMIRSPASDPQIIRPDAVKDRPWAILKRPAFWLLGISVFCINAGSLGFVSQLQSIVLEKGLEAGQAPILLSLLAASVFVSRIAVGFLLDVARAERVAAGVISFAAVGAIVWLMAPPTFFFAAIAVCLIAFSIGSELDLMSFFCARLFGLQNFSAAYGALSVFFYCGIAAGGIAYGVIHDRMGSYEVAISGSGVLFMVAAILFLLIRSRSNAILPVLAQGDASVIA